MNARKGAWGEARTLLEQDDSGETTVVEVPQKHGGDTALVVPVSSGTRSISLVYISEAGGRTFRGRCRMPHSQ